MTKYLGFAVLAVVLAGCGSEKKTEEKAAEKAAETSAVTKVDPATAATISGKVTFTGKAPARKVIQMGEEAACVRMHHGPVYTEEVVVNPNGTLANVFVYVKTGLEGKNFETPKEPVSIEQTGCSFKPHVIGIQTGQTFAVVNKDPVTHNIHPMPKDNLEWNQGQAPGAPNLERVFSRPEIMIPVKCNVHAWMRSYIGVVAHPYFAVTGEDGSFSLKGLPPGEYTVAAWQEKYGAQEQKVTVGPSATQTVAFSFSGS